MSNARALHQQIQQLSDFDCLLINTLQSDFPLDPAPFDELAGRLDYSAEAIMAGVKSLLDRGVITRFGPLFNIEQLGGQFSLCALKVPERRFDAVAELVNSYPQVAHNYQREHEWNMWFVMATESAAELLALFEEILQRTDCPGLNLPKEKEFYVGLNLQA
ncbi:MAG: Lrp/AsnC family transcriptional regulator [Halioglobus sp.]